MGTPYHEVGQIHWICCLNFMFVFVWNARDWSRTSCIASKQASYPLSYFSGPWLCGYISLSLLICSYNDSTIHFPCAFLAPEGGAPEGQALHKAWPGDSWYALGQGKGHGPGEFSINKLYMFPTNPMPAMGISGSGVSKESSEILKICCCDG